MRSYLTVIAIFCAWNAYAQVRGSISTPASPMINPMDPNGDGFITTTGTGFSGPLDQTEFELSFIPLQVHEPEPGADNQYAPGCEFYELASDPAVGAYPAYFYFSDPDGISDNGDELLLFRLRVARYSNGSTAFSILVDTDYSFGFEGAEADPNAVAGNPGFEKEIALFNNTGAGGGVRVYNVDGSAETAIVDFYAPITSNHQVSYALNQDPACSDRVPVFVDMYVPFSALGISSTRQIRMAAAANEDIASSLKGGASDIGGIDGNRLPDDDHQFITLINNYLPVRVDEPANIAPRGLDATLALDENSPNGVILHTVGASDTNGDILFFNIDRGNTNNAFAIDEATGTLSVNNSFALDHESNTSFTLVVRVSDGRLYDNVILTINLNDVNDNAPVLSDAIVSINENLPADAIAHTVDATDADATATLTHTIAGGSGAAIFEIDPSSGVITVSDPAALDFESIKVFTLSIQVSDGSFSVDALLTINLDNVNEPPLVIGLSAQFNGILYNGAVVYVAVADDPDEGDVIAYSIASANEFPVFTINSQTGEIVVTGIEELGPGVTTHGLVVTATDAGGLSGQGIIVLELEKKPITPNKGFSPNGDEQNDFWWIDGIEGFPNNTVKIFNRWGQQIMEIPGYDNNEHVWRGEGWRIRVSVENTYFFVISAGKFQPITGYVIVKP